MLPAFVSVDIMYLVGTMPLSRSKINYTRNRIVILKNEVGILSTSPLSGHFIALNKANINNFETRI